MLCRRLYPRWQRALIALVLSATALLTSGCVAPYDQTSDQSITSLEKQLDTHIDTVSQQPPAATQPVDRAFYIGLRNDLHALHLRTEARGEDPSLVKQEALLDEISGQIDKVEQLEGTHLHGAEAWQTVKDGVGTNVKGFLTMELARKGTNAK